MTRHYFASISLLLTLLTLGCKTSAPSSSSLQLIETGVASWYGPNFNGKPTATGEVYNMNGLTAAHRTLPFDTKVKVINKDNGRSVTVRVNDRGPYAKNRIIDLSKAAAQKLDMIGPGTANVRLYASEDALRGSNITDLKVPHYTIQLGSFEDKASAIRKAATLKGARVEEVQIKSNTLYRLYYGLFTDPAKAKREQARLKNQGWDGFVKQVEN
ncbi:MAG: septal ring lytic transglycosylase RlpA family protein [Cyclobacteriaceae bacterium]